MNGWIKDNALARSNNGKVYVRTKQRFTPVEELFLMKIKKILESGKQTKTNIRGECFEKQ